MKFVAVISCLTGIVHSQMMAENLLQTGECLGHGVDVEVRGTIGAQDKLASDATAEANTVIITSDTSVNRGHFDGKLALRGMAKDGVNNAEVVTRKAVELAKVGKTGLVTFGSGDDGEDADANADDSSGDADAAESDEPVRRGGDSEKRLSTRLKKLFL